MSGEAERFATFVLPADENGCARWSGTHDAGYGKFSWHGRMIGAHRAAWMLANGDIPDGVEIDHVCFVRDCVSLAHLRPASHKANNEHRNGANRNSKSGVRGVIWSKQKNRWQARVRANYKQVHVGFFDTIEEAEAAVIAKRLELFTHSDPERRA